MKERKKERRKEGKKERRKKGKKERKVSVGLKEEDGSGGGGSSAILLKRPCLPLAGKQYAKGDLWKITPRFIHSCTAIGPQGHHSRGF